MAKTALITGVTGQDGAYLAKLLLDKNYKVFGSRRRGSSLNNWRLDELAITPKINMIEMDLIEYSNIMDVIKKYNFDEIYNLAAQSFVSTSFIQPIYTAEIDGLAVCRILEAIRQFSPRTHFYQASTSEMFGKVQATPQNETTNFYPRSPYGIAKLYGHWTTVNYRESYDLYAVSGILFNHESPLRGQEFVTRKITASLAKIKNNMQDVLELGNIDAKRDWGFAGDYVRAMYLMLQQDKPEDYVIASNNCYSVREFIELASRLMNFDIQWQGSGQNEKAIDKKTGKIIIQINPDFYRPSEVDILKGDCNKAKKKLGWQPEINFEQMVEMMVKKDLERIKSGIILQ